VASPTTSTADATTVTVTEPGPITRDGDVVDTVEMEGFDGGGNRVFGPFFVPFSTRMTFPAPPAEVVTLEVDYLRNGGYALYRCPIQRGSDGKFDLDDPVQHAIELHDTGHSIVVVDGDHQILTTHSGAQHGSIRQKGSSVRPKAVPLTHLKGVCYSPAPINFRNIDAPSLGDLFWDSSADAFNWYALWGKGALGETGFNARDDLGKMRELGINCLRTYCMLSRQLYVIDEKGNYKEGEIPDPPDKFHHFTHKQFLDLCWNNGHDPIYVLIGIPLPPDVLYKYGGGSPQVKAFWDFVLKETVTDTKDHPAVLGYTLFNEIDENVSAWPGVDQSAITGGEQNENSDYYYGKLKEYSKAIHDITGREDEHRKLVGWAAHDNRPFVHYGSTVPAGQPYFTQLTDIDYYGVNTYQAKSLDSVVGDTLEGAYGKLTGASKKPLILTELGWPGVGHKDNQLYEDETTRTKAAEVIASMIPKAFASKLVLGVMYFEYADEWWKQPPNNATEWNGGPRDDGMPNGFHDQEAFGLFSTKRAGTRKNTDAPYHINAPVLPVDDYVERTELTKALKKAYADVTD